MARLFLLSCTNIAVVSGYAMARVRKDAPVFRIVGVIYLPLQFIAILARRKLQGDLPRNASQGKNRRLNQSKS